MEIRNYYLTTPQQPAAVYLTSSPGYSFCKVSEIGCGDEATVCPAVDSANGCQMNTDYTSSVVVGVLTSA